VISLSDSFNQMAVSLDDQERVRRDFIANAAHELRTPLTNLQGYVEALRDGVIAPSREQFTSLHEEVERLVRLAKSLDSLAESNTESHAPDTVDVDLAQGLRTAAELARPVFDAKAIHFETSIAHGLRARGDPDRLAQVLSNLLQNAARYTPREGRVCLSAEPRRDGALVTVTNSGEGIPSADLPRVFERFYRVEKSRDSARGGAGIGLAIVKQLVEADRGEVGAESQPGTTQFWFRLPA
jgi:signal transduction histidine kinase